MDTTSLRALLELLKEFGVTKYSAQGVSLELGGSVSIHKHSSEPGEPRPARKVDQKLVDAMAKLDPAYQAMFRLGDD